MIPKDYITAWRTHAPWRQDAHVEQEGRDLFDLWFAIEQDGIDTETLLRCFNRYMTEGGYAVTRAQFEANLHGKAGDHDFRDDIVPLLRPGIDRELAQARRERHLERVDAVDVADDGHHGNDTAAQSCCGQGRSTSPAGWTSW